MVHKCYGKPEGKSGMDNQELATILEARHEQK